MRTAFFVAFLIGLASCGGRDLGDMTPADMPTTLPDGGTCNDHTLDGDETDVDCGGSCTTKCPRFEGCKVDADCGVLTGAGGNSPLVCVVIQGNGACDAPSIYCKDGQRNGDETDKDCGGPHCSPCIYQQNCKVATDCVSGLCSGGTCGALSLAFADGKSFPFVPGILAADVADVDGDGKKDLIGISGQQDGAGVALGKGDGTFDNMIALPLVMKADGPYALAAGDIDGTGRAALVTSHNMQLYVWPNIGTKGTVKFDSPMSFSSMGTSPSFPIFRDLNGDGLADLVTVDGDADPNTSNYSVFININAGKGPGSAMPFTTHKLSTGGAQPTYPILGDWNGDGIPDVGAISDSSTIITAVNKGDGKASFGAWATTDPGVVAGQQFIPWQLGYGAVDQGGYDDILVVNPSNSKTQDVAIMSGNGMNKFQKAQSLGLKVGGPIAVADFDLDSHPDLAVADTNGLVVNIFLGSGMRQFKMAAHPKTGDLAADRLIVTDLNNDKHPDLVVITEQADHVEVIMNTSK